ncbi:MAG: clan AA aspartic protease [Candidatus Eremiobacteraeota bacterium]|nr:clan AA aspartic protease [Candidatus Eremiobacteraeota bacterium]
MIDTGAPNIVLHESLARQLHLNIHSAGVGVFAGGRHAAVQSTLVPSLTIGALHIRNVPAVVMPDRQFLPGPHHMDGIIGAGLLMHFVSTLDYVNGALILRPLSANLTLAPASISATEPMWLVGDHFIFARGRINDAPEALFSIDTGLAGGGVQATKAQLAAAHITLDEAHASNGMGGGGIVKFIPFKAVVGIGDASVTDVRGIYTPEGDQFAIFPFAVAGTISHDYFRHFIVTFDFTKMQLTVQRP